MRWLSRIGKKPLAERRLDAELQFHLEQQIADYVNSGMPPEEAQRDALLRFGNSTVVKERVAAMDAALVLDSIRQDVQYGI